MMKSLVIGIAVICGFLISGCGPSTVDERDVENWKNEGRAPGDKPNDPNSDR